jgi:hypothetical protein
VCDTLLCYSDEKRRIVVFSGDSFYKFMLRRGAQKREQAGRFPIPSHRLPTAAAAPVASMHLLSINGTTQAPGGASTVEQYERMWTDLQACASDARFSSGILIYNKRSFQQCLCCQYTVELTGQELVIRPGEAYVMQWAEEGCFPVQVMASL